MCRLTIATVFLLSTLSTSLSVAEEPTKPKLNIEELTKAIDQNRGDAWAYVQRAQAYINTGKIDLAERDLKSAFLIDVFSSPAHRAVAHKIRANVRSEKHEYREAVADLNEVLRLNPGSKNVYSHRGWLNYRLGEYHLAKSDYEKAIEADPKELIGNMNFARLLACCPVDELRDGAKAIVLATEACEMTEWKDPLCVVNLSLAHAEQGDFELALSLLDAAAESDPQVANPFKPQFRMKIPYRDRPVETSKNPVGKDRGADATQVITTVEAAKRVGEIVTVQMQVRSAGSNPAGYIELYSAPTWQEEGAFFVRFSAASQTLFKKINITDIGRHFRGSTVRVHGEVKTLRFLNIDHQVIYVERLEQIEVVTNPVNSDSNRSHSAPLPPNTPAKAATSGE